MDLTDKITIVTGASSGLGKAFSEAFINEGATVYGLARSEGKLNHIHEEFGNRFRPITMDVTNHDAIEEWVKETFSENHAPQVLVNNAGLARFADIDELTLDDWHSMINTNLNGTFYITRHIVPYMKQQKDTCHIINIASIAGKVAGEKMTGYNASKFGVRGFTEALFKEVRYEGIKVTCFLPGSSNTHFFDRIDGVEAHDNMLQPADVAQRLVDVIETPDNFLVDEVVMRPLNPKPPER
ncbi:MAG TPA: SDR family NAD(P)-dependent oxidoreductase [Balneolaceae bacterium]|nr:SDR family NAD(P)-dependent oxidoreductase [Balneolaceae bacterium]